MSCAAHRPRTPVAPVVPRENSVTCFRCEDKGEDEDEEETQKFISTVHLLLIFIRVSLGFCLKIASQIFIWLLAHCDLIIYDVSVIVRGEEKEN